VGGVREDAGYSGALGGVRTVAYEGGCGST
jgi:hypothetical protein